MDETMGCVRGRMPFQRLPTWFSNAENAFWEDARCLASRECEM